jgi:hypothetical protein
MKFQDLVKLLGEPTHDQYDAQLRTRGIAFRCGCEASATATYKRLSVNPCGPNPRAAARRSELGRPALTRTRCI